jgi:hypothetical protein
MFKDEQIENKFTYYKPKDDQAKKYEVIRLSGKRMAYLLSNLCPEGRELSLAITKLEESVMWANASIARNK